MGFATFKCDWCWKKHRQYFSCKSKFCTSCAIAAMGARLKNFISWRPQHLHTYHSFFTIPQELRRFFCINRECEKAALRMMQQTACKVMENFFLETSNVSIFFVCTKVLVSLWKVFSRIFGNVRFFLYGVLSVQMTLSVEGLWS